MTDIQRMILNWVIKFLRIEPKFYHISFEKTDDGDMKAIVDSCDTLSTFEKISEKRVFIRNIPPMVEIFTRQD